MRPGADWPDDCPKWTPTERVARCLAWLLSTLAFGMALAYLAGLIALTNLGFILLVLLNTSAILCRMQAEQWQTKRILGYAVLEMERRLPEVYLRGRSDALGLVQDLLAEHRVTGSA